MGFYMNKSKVLLVALLAYATTSQAKITPVEVCSLLNVQIKNNSSNDCVVKKAYSAFGRFVNSSQFPEVIFKGKEATFSLTHSFRNIEYLEIAVLMSFQCGEDREVTLFTSTPSIFHSSVLEHQNMDAEFGANYCDRNKNTPWEIEWELKDSPSFEQGDL